jgi:hypothetical protein
VLTQLAGYSSATIKPVSCTPQYLSHSVTLHMAVAQQQWCAQPGSPAGQHMPHVSEDSFSTPSPTGIPPAQDVMCVHVLLRALPPAAADTLHRFCKKEHDWGWKKFMELNKVLDGFTVSDTLVIKAQVQVIL